MYRQRRREQARLSQHEDPLAQLADIITQQAYLEGESNVTEPLNAIESMERTEEETVDVSGIVYEDGEILNNFDDDRWTGGFGDNGDIDVDNDDEWNDGFDGEFDLEINDDGIQFMTWY
jgi:hypothetical protein